MGNWEQRRMTVKLSTKAIFAVAALAIAMFTFAPMASAACLGMNETATCTCYNQLGVAQSLNGVAPAGSTPCSVAVCVFAFGFPNIAGSSGADVITGTNSADNIAAGGGNDRVCALGGADNVDLGDGSDMAQAGGGSDAVAGGNGADNIDGQGGGSDKLNGQAGNDTLLDIIGNNNKCTGGADADPTTCVGLNQP
jgi:Ca2+-binding RTX toxin-like protein